LPARPEFPEAARPARQRCADSTTLWGGCDGEGIVYVADTDESHAAEGHAPRIVTTLLDPGIVAVDGTGSDARFSRPQGLAIDDGGNLYVGRYHNHTVRKLSIHRVVTTVGA